MLLLAIITILWFGFDVLFRMLNAKFSETSGFSGGIAEAARISEIFPGHVLDKLPPIMPNAENRQPVRGCRFKMLRERLLTVGEAVRACTVAIFIFG